MRTIITLISFFISSYALAQEIEPVEDSSFNLCKPYGCTYFEWKFKSDSSLRYIASGYEDGIDYSFYRVNQNGKLELLLRINPVIKDKSNKYWWGYPWSTTDIPVKVKNNQIYFYANLTHKIVRDGNIRVPEWQKTMPAILLEGYYGKWKIAEKEYEYELLSIPELVERSKNANKALK